MMTFSTPLKFTATLGTALLLSACAENFEGVTSTSDPAPLRAIGDDRGRDAAHLSTMEAGIYIDPDGCQIWMIDDGLEGYWSRRRDPVSGLPVCTNVAPPGSIVGDTQAGAGIRDRVPRTP
ncbi:hypothetical protein [Alterinioella nitratireducens]|uniref:hypothetical protein n=1 Tax=Alterinioella nitratireducens TaxID=2735915 RepID=UPI000C51201A|nr:hypothetical protein [Alterinioella nitratireducens]MAN14993.1 hypothetical protein [Dinoroseobacter sp.]MAX74331.1 hypothetical protein [Nioella sp.]NPD20410.1 hypothetical protein [Alterinioella nitratireducens]|tara:strand:- start:347 stop:709 length:363 start_codon:yes stop_codon:yes gene_type:complete